MLLSGRAADLLGRRSMLMLGLGMFTLASLACGLATSQSMLVVARGVQGVGASIVTAVALSMVLALFPEPGERAKAMSVWGFVGSGGGTVGVLAGGILTQSLNWHWIFLVNVPIGVLVLVLARPLLPSTPGLGLRQGLDVWGTVAVVAAPILAVYGIVNAGQEGLTSPVTLACLAGAVLLSVAFVLIESRVKAPLVPLRVFRSRTVKVSAVLVALSGASMFGWFFFSPLYGRNILGFDALQTSLTFLPATLTMGALSLGLTARIVGRFGPKRPLVLGMLLFTSGHLMFARAPIDGTFFPDILVPDVRHGCRRRHFLHAAGADRDQRGCAVRERADLGGDRDVSDDRRLHWPGDPGRRGSRLHGWTTRRPAPSRWSRSTTATTWRSWSPPAWPATTAVLAARSCACRRRLRRTTAGRSSQAPTSWRRRNPSTISFHSVGRSQCAE